MIGLVQAKATPLRTRPRQGADHRLTWALVALVLAGSLAATYLLFRSSRLEAEQDLQADFYFRARDAEARIAQRMSAYEQVLRGAQGLFAAFPQVDRRAFHDYVSALGLEQNYPGIQGVGFALLVPAEARARHVAALRREGFQDYLLRPEGERDPYTAIVYLEPFSGRNLRAFGYDMLSEPVRRAAMERARDTDVAALSGRVTLVQETGTEVQAGCLMYLPVYRKGARHETLLERHASLVGWVYEPFRMGDLMSGLLGERAAELEVWVYDGRAIADATLMYAARAGGPAHRPSFEVVRTLEVAGRNWTLVVRSTPGFEARLDTAKSTLIALAGTGASLLLILVVWLLASARARALRAARAMNADLIEAQRALVESTAELRTSQEQLALVIEGSDDDYWDWDLRTGEITRGPRYARRLGHGPEAIRSGREDFAARVHPDDRPLVLAALDAHLEGRTPQYDVEYRIHTRAGTWRWQRSRAKVVARDPAGRPLRVAGMVTDVDEKRRADEERRLLAGITRTMGDALVIVDPELRITGWTGAAEQLYGFAVPEALGRSLPELFAQEFPDGDGKAFRRRLASEGAARARARHRRRDGTALDVDQRVEALRDESGRHIGYFSVNRDVTQQRAAERALRESEARFRAMADSAPVLIWISGTDQRCTWFNRPWLEFTGRALEEEVGDGWKSGVHRADLERVDRARREPFGHQRPYSVEYRFRRRDGQYRWLIESGTPRRDERGAFAGYIGSCIDITDRKYAEDAVRAAQRFTQATLDAMSEQICVLDDHGNVIAVNAAWRAFAIANQARSSNVLEGMNYFEVCARAKGSGAGEAAAFAAGLTEVLAGRRQSFSLEYECHSPREQRWFVANATRFAEDGLVRAVVAHVDISPRKRVELALLESQALVRGIVETTPDPVYVKDAEGRMLLANPACLKALGHPADAVLGKRSPDYQPDRAVSDALLEHDALVMRSGVAGLFEERIDTPEGSRVYLSTRSPRRDGKGSITGIIGISRDISDRKRLELERERLLEEAWTATQRREQMLAVVAHDLRSPLGAVVLAAHALERFCSDASQRKSFDERLEIIRTATERMGRLIEDLLDVAAIQSGRLRLAPAGNDAGAIAHEAVRISLPEAKRREVTLDLYVEGAPLPVRCDRGRIVQVLNNLLSNAFHATSRGGQVTVRVRRAERGAVLSVTDDGRGLPPGRADSLFEPYQRGPNPGYKGAGLGLAIAKGIVDGHGGRIWAESPATGGATFAFEVPGA